MHLVGFIIRIYHDARSSECQITVTVVVEPLFTYIVPICDRKHFVLIFIFLISNFRRVLNVVFFFLLLCGSPASEFYVVPFRNTMSVPSS